MSYTCPSNLLGDREPPKKKSKKRKKEVEEQTKKFMKSNDADEEADDDDDDDFDNESLSAAIRYQVSCQCVSLPVCTLPASR